MLFGLWIANAISYHTTVLPPPMLAIHIHFAAKQQTKDSFVFVLHDTFQCYYY